MRTIRNCCSTCKKEFTRRQIRKFCSRTCYYASVAERVRGTGNPKYKHGHAGKRPTPEYYAWTGMFGRCYDKSHQSYANYGGRGIRVCRRWSKFERFLSDMGRRPSAFHEIEREDNNKGYSPENCKWATVRQQARNRRSNVRVRFRGQTKCLIEWAEATGISYDTILNRRRFGWSVTRMLTTPQRILKCVR